MAILAGGLRIERQLFKNSLERFQDIFQGSSKTFAGLLRNFFDTVWNSNGLSTVSKSMLLWSFCFVSWLLFFSVFCNILKHSPKTLWQFFKLLGDPLMLIQHLLAIFQNLLAIFGHPFRWFYRDSPKWDECFNSITGQIFLNMSESLSFEKCLQWKLWKIVFFVCLFVCLLLLFKLGIQFLYLKKQKQSFPGEFVILRCGWWV